MDNTLIIILVVLALIFDFLNGFHDSANVVATMISSRAMTPTAALIIATSANFIGPFIFGQFRSTHFMPDYPAFKGKDLEPISPQPDPFIFKMPPPTEN